jgi:pyruvate,water dikinase
MALIESSDLNIVSLNQLDALAARQYGAKASNLADLLCVGVRIPPGVALGRNVLAYFLRENGIDLAALERIHSLGMIFLESALVEAQDWQAKIVQTITSSPFPAVIVDKLFDCLGNLKDRKLAVRSSCSVEDASSTSFAGQYATVLNVSGKDEVLQAIRSCWISQYDGRVLKYAISRRGMPVLSPSMAVLIQEMLNPDFAGVCFTEGPTSSTRQFTIVESVHGCGEALVSGAETPCHFEVNKDGAIHRVIVPPTASNLKPKDEIVLSVVSTSRRIATHFGCPQDVEWAVVKEELFILQARPITVIGGARKGAPVGLPSRTSRDSSKAKHAPDNSLLLLRDDLHDWLITKVDPLVYRGASYILSNQYADGSWRIEGHPEWDAVATAMIVQLLLEGGIPSMLQWSIPQAGGTLITVGLPSAVNWLTRNVKEDGTWGTDIWDTCQVVRSLVKCGISPDEPLVAKAINFVSDQITRGLDSSSEKEWYGAGFLAVAMRLFSELGMKEKVTECAKLLLHSQASSGEFCGLNKEGLRVPSEWHTAQAISALFQYANDTVLRNAITCACDWLLERQHRNGSWGVTEGPYSRYNTFFTAYAVLALTDAGPNYTNSVGKACKWIRGQQVASGAFGDLGSSLMAMATFQKIHGPVFTISMPIPMFLRVQTTLSAP